MKQTNKENKQGTSQSVDYTKPFIPTKDFSNLLLIEAIIPGEVKEWGSSAHIPFQKKFIGKKVKVIIYTQLNHRRYKNGNTK